MPMQQILKFMILCDAHKPNGEPCTCDLIVEAFSASSAKIRAEQIGWTVNDFGDWTCNAAGGHQEKEY